MHDIAAWSQQLAAVRSALLRSERILFVTGAGISADSGLPTYRGVGGLYDGKATDDGYAIEEALSATVWRSRPDITWKYLWQIGHACVDAKPNAAHLAIASWQQHKPQCTLLTQNVDGLHRKAGSTDLIEIHGHAFDLYCCGCGRAFDAAQLINNYHDGFGGVPTCAHCGGIVRPNVVLFEEMLPEPAIGRLQDVLNEPLDMVVSIGTSAAFPYIVQPLLIGRRQGAVCVDINPDAALARYVDYQLPLSAATAMAQLMP
jgi:NAD-dependent deacetylase